MKTNCHTPIIIYSWRPYSVKHLWVMKYKDLLCSPLSNNHPTQKGYHVQHRKLGFFAWIFHFSFMGISRTKSKTVFFYMHTLYSISSVSDVYEEQWMRSIHPRYAPPTGSSSVWEAWSAISERGEYIAYILD